MTAIIVVAEKRILCILFLSITAHHHHHRRLAYHSNAPKATAPLAAPQTVPLQKFSPPKNTATARKPASQKTMVRASAAKMPNLCAAAGKKRGERAR